MRVKDRILVLSLCILFPMFIGCASNTPSGENKIRSQESAAQQAHQEMQESFDSDEESDQLDMDYENNTSRSFEQREKGLPSWVTSPPSSSQYVYGVGSAKIRADPADAMSRAKDQARTEILKRMEVTVVGRTRARVSRQVKDGKSQVTRSIMDRVQTRVSETRLRHVRPVDTYVDQKEDTAYALLRLDRDAAKADLVGQLEEIEGRLREIASRETGGARLKQLNLVMPALPLLEKRHQIVKKLHMVNGKDADFHLPADLRRLQERIATLLDSLVVVLRPRNQESEKLAAGLRKALNNQGLRVRQNGRADVLLRYDLDLRRIERDGVQFVFAQGAITVLNGKGDVLNEFQEKAKAASQDSWLARERALTRLARVLGQKLAESLFKSFELNPVGTF